MYLALSVSLLSWTGWMHEREDKLRRFEILETELIELHRFEILETDTEIKEQILSVVTENRDALRALVESQTRTLSPACDTRR